MEALEQRRLLASGNLAGIWVGILTDPQVTESVWQETISLAGSGGSYTGYRLSQVTDSSDFVEWSATASLSGQEVQVTDQSVYDSSLGSSEYLPITATMRLSGSSMSGTWSGSGDGVTYTGTIQLILQTRPGESGGAVNLSGTWIGTLTDPEVAESDWQETVDLTGSRGSYSGYRLSQVPDSSDFVEWSATASLSGDQVQMTDQSVFDSYLGSSEYLPITATMTLSGGSMSGTWTGSDDGVTYTGTIQLSLQSAPLESSGAIALNTPTDGAINTAGQAGDWTFYGTTGESVAAQLNPGPEGSQPAAYPQLDWGQVELLDPSNDVLASASSSSSGSIAGFNGITLPADGTYTIQVQVPYGEPISTGNYVLSAFDVTNLTLGTAYSGTLAGSGQSQLFAVNVPSAQSLVVAVQDSSSDDVNELYAKLGSPPTPNDYDDSSANGFSADPQLLVPSAAQGDWYILLDSESVPSTPSRFTMSVNGTPMTLTDVAPARSATGSPATLVLTGSGFNNTTSVELIGSGKMVYKAETTTLDTFTQLMATFTLSGVPPGVYSVEVTAAGGQSAELPATFTVTAPGAAKFEDRLILPGAIGLHTSATFYVEYSNQGNVAMPAPLLVVGSTNSQDLPLLTLNPALAVSGYWNSVVPEGYSNTVEILASGGVPGWLEPGQSITVPVYYAGMQQTAIGATSDPFNLVVYTNQDTTAANWGSLQASLQPPGMSSTAWSAIFGVLQSQLGSTWGGYVTTLDNEASYLGRLGEDVTNVGQLWSFAVMLADGLTPTPTLAGGTDLDVVAPGDLSLDFSRLYQEPISARDALGPLGYGWSDDWQYSLSVASDATVTVTMPSGELRVFQPESDGFVYSDQPGDNGVLTAGGDGIFTLHEQDGEIEAFNANGTLNYLQDTNGNKVMAGYTGGQLTALRASSGADLTLTYNTAGLISSATSSDGRKVTYAYDSGDHLVAVTSYDGEVTRYTYATGSDSATVNALTEIEYPDGTSESFAYNTAGELTGTAETGGADPVTYTYNLGEVTESDAAGDTTESYFDDDAHLIKTINPLGSVAFSTYDSNGDLTSITGPTGLSTLYTYDAQGNLTSTTDALGQTTTYTYSTTDDLLASFTDADGDTTNYNYDSSGDLTSIEYPDGTVAKTTYDALGDPLELTDPDGRATGYSYNSAGQVATETLAGGSTMTYTYDTRGNLITATDPSGVTSLIYGSSDQLTSVIYPGSQSLTYTYNAGGNRTQLIEKSGSTITYTVNYSYNSLGQLAELTDGTGTLIISYTYNNVGEVTRENKGDGTYTIYAYDKDGNVIDLINYAANGTVDSSFAYSYNAVGEETSMATIDGTWTYSYDADGELIHAVFASTATAVPSQNLTYVYNAVGDRMQTIVNGVTSNYTSNNVNEYTTVSSTDGTTRYTYNADGDLVSETDSSGTTTYTYDSLNRLVSETSPTDSWVYEYDALGNVVATIHDGQTTDNLVDPSGQGSVVAQYTGSETLIASYTYGLGLVSQVTLGKTNYYDVDALGSTVGLTNRASGLVASYSYLPFGGLLASTGSVANPFGFIGLFGASAGASGLLNMRARSYNPTDGAFVSVDPLGVSGSGANLYEYASNDPVGGSDPTGMSTTLYGHIYYNEPDPAVDQASQVASFWSEELDFVGALGKDLGTDALASGLEPFGKLLGGAGLVLGLPKLASSIATAVEDPTLDNIADAGFESLAWGLGAGALFAGGVPALLLGGAAFGIEIGLQIHQMQYPEIVADVGGETSPSNPDGGDVNDSGGYGYTTGGGYGYTSRSAGSTSGTSGFASTSGSFGRTSSGAGLRGSSSSGRSFSFPSGGAGQGGSSEAPFGGGSSGSSFDPNAMIGPKGSGGANFVSASALTLYPYKIEFENAPTATAPAKQVVITDALDRNLDLNTFQLTDIAFGATMLAVPPGSQNYQTTVPVTQNGQAIEVVVNAGLDYATRQLTVTFQSINPQTGQPFTGQTGFLPPENGTGQGQGYVSFVISPKASLATGTQIRNVGQVTFDSNPPIPTDLISDEDPSLGVDPDKQALITVDNTLPTSSVAVLPATESSDRFTVRWSGSDGNGSGVARYDVYVSDDGSAFKPFLTDTAKTSATFKGEADHTYRFYSVATSNVGMVQPTPTAAQARTTVHIEGSRRSHQAASTPLVTVTTVQAVANKKHQVSEILLTFSGAVNASEAQHPSIYRLATPGKHGSFTAKNAGIIKLRSAVYDGADDTVALIVKKPFKLSKPVQVRVDGTPPSGLQDATGQYIDGADNRSSGSDAVAVLSRGGATIDAVELVRTHSQAATTSTGVDALLEQDELAGLSRALRARRAGRLAHPHRREPDTPEDRLFGPQRPSLIFDRRHPRGTP